jgi:radical SAM superfamily enzyme YgiQ (UPF0313 family)
MSSVLQNDGHDVNIIIFKGVEYISPTEIPPSEKQDEGGYYSMCTYTTAKELDILLNLLKEQDPHLVGISFTSISYGLAQFLTRKIQTELKTPVIWGGVDSTVNANENIQHTDMICLGEGEFPVRNLVNAMDRGEDILHIPSIWVKKDGVIYRNPMMKLEQNLDLYPFPDFELENKTIVINDAIYPSPYPPRSHLYTNFIIMATRGCPFTCTYCCSGHDDVIYQGDKFLRRRSVENVIEELRYRVRAWPWKLERVEFYDDVLPLNKRWIQQFSPAYSTEVALPFFGYTHPNVGDPDILNLLTKAGLSYLIMGIQSGSQRTLKKYYDRRHPKQGTIRTAQNILDAGAKLLVDFIGYNPLELEEDNVETLDLICDLPRPIGIVNINPMAFYDNYKIFHIAHKEGIVDQLERPLGVHALQAKPKPIFVFWEFMHMLGHFDGFTKEHVMGLVQDRYLREHPAIFEEMVANLYHATYLDGNPVVNKDQYIQNMRWRVARIEGSSAFRAYQKIKSLVA